MSTRLLVSHQQGPDSEQVEVAVGLIDRGLGKAPQESISDQRALVVPAVEIEALADTGSPSRTTSVASATTEQVIFEMSSVLEKSALLRH